MSDLISRQTVINAIANTCFWLSGDDWNELIECINSIPSVENKGEWIPVSKRNPDIYKRVEKYLITDDEGIVRTACFVNCGEASWWDYLHVTAWQPLPEPYKAEGVSE